MTDGSSSQEYSHSFLEKPMARPTPPERRLRSGNGSAHLHSEPTPERLARLEAAVASIQQTLEVQFKRMAAMQAELDHLAAQRRNG
jgi:hypothetical protein